MIWKKIVVAAGVTLCVCAQGFSQLSQDWRAQLSPAAAGNFAPLRPLTAKYDLGWTAFTAGSVTLHWEKSGAAEWRASADGGTTGWVRSLWRLDARAVSRLDARTLLPLEFEQTENYSDHVVHTHLQFANGEVRYWRSSTWDKTPAKWKTLRLEGLHDLFSALFWVRSQRLAVGQEMSLVVFPATTPYLAKVTVLGREEIVVSGRSWRALKLKIELQKVTKKLALEPHPKFKRGVVWISDDAQRLPLRVRAEIFVGSVWAELREVQPEK